MTTMERPEVGVAGTARLKETVFENVADAIVTTDLSGRLTTFNPAAERLFGIPREEVIGRTLAESLIDREDLLEVSDAILDARHRPNDVHERELAVDTPTGCRHLVVRSSLLKEEAVGRPVGLVATFQDVSAQVQLMRQRIEAASLFVLLIVSFAVATVIGLLLDRFTDIDVYSKFFSWGYLLSLTLPVFVCVVYVRYPLADVGLTFRAWRDELRVAGIISLAMVAVVALLAVGKRLAAGGPVDATILDPARLTLGMLTYLPHAFLQEFIARGVLQSSLRRLLADERGRLSILLATTVFAVFHAHFGIEAVLLVFVSGLGFGWVFHRNGSLLAVTLVHFVAGFAALASGLL